MTKHECAVIMAFTGVVMLKGNDLDIFYEYVAKILGRPVYTHEIGILADEIKESARADFIRLCAEADDRRTITNGDKIRQPVRRGRWECGGVCSECGLDNEELKTDYCPNCGARMDGGAENGN